MLESSLVPEVSEVVVECVGVQIAPRVEELIRNAVGLVNLARHGRDQVERVFVGERGGVLYFHDAPAELIGSVPEKLVELQDGVWQRRA